LKLSQVQRAEVRAAKILKSPSEARELMNAVTLCDRKDFAYNLSVQMSLYIPPASGSKRALEEFSFSMYKTPQTRLFRALLKLEPPELIEKQMGNPANSSAPAGRRFPPPPQLLEVKPEQGDGSFFHMQEKRAAAFGKYVDELKAWYKAVEPITGIHID